MSVLLYEALFPRKIEIYFFIGENIFFKPSLGVSYIILVYIVPFALRGFVSEKNRNLLFFGENIFFKFFKFLIYLGNRRLERTTDENSVVVYICFIYNFGLYCPLRFTRLCFREKSKFTFFWREYLLQIF